jgi:hypothetical protein
MSCPSVGRNFARSSSLYFGLAVAPSVVSSMKLTSQMQGLNAWLLSFFSWAGLYDGRYDILTLKDLVVNDDKYDHVRRNVKSAEVIIIDEISMSSQKLFEQLEAVCNLLHDKNKYFGGLQVILCGDFYQLPPVPDEVKLCVKMKSS